MGSDHQYLESAQTSKLFDLLLQLATDLYVVSHRVRVLEAALVREGMLEHGQVDAFAPDGAEEKALADAANAFTSRLVRVITESGPSEHPLRGQWETLLAAAAET